MRDREHLACLRVRGGVIQLERMHFADEVRPTKGLAPKGVRVAKTELDMAVKLVKQVSGTFDPKRFKDTYRDRLLQIIRAKEQGKTVEVAEEVAEEPVDLMAALRESVAAARKSKPKRGRRRAKKAA